MNDNKNKEPKNWIKGSATERTGQGYSLISLDLLVDDVLKLPKNAAGYVKITLSKMAQPDKYGNTHSIFENTWKPDKNIVRAATPAAKTKPMGAGMAQGNSDDLPF